MSFITNVGVTFLTRIFTLLIGITTSVIVARILGPEGQGIYALAILVPSMIVTFTNLGIARATVYHMGKGTYPRSDLVGTVLTSSFIISLGSIIIGLVIVFFFSNSILPTVPQVFLLLSLALIPFQLLFFQSLSGILLGLQEIKKYNALVIIHSISLLALIAFFLMILDAGIAGAITANLLSLLLTVIVATPWILKSSNGMSRYFQLDKRIVGSLFSFGYKAYLGNAVSFLHLRIDTLMLNYFLSPLVVGFYVISVAVVEKLWMLSQAVSTVLYPKVVAMKDEEEKKRFTPLVSRNTLLLTILGALLLFGLSKWLIPFLYSEAYLPSVEPLQVLLIGIVAISVERILANDIIARGKPMIYTYIASASLITNIILNIILIQKFGIMGAAWATSITYSLMAIVELFVYCRLSGNSAIDVILFKKSDIKLYFRILKDWKSALK